MLFSFNLFYHVEFRSSIIAQDFPDEIENLEQVDILRSGLFISADYSGTVVAGFNESVVARQITR